MGAGLDSRLPLLGFKVLPAVFSRHLVRKCVHALSTRRFNVERLLLQLLPRASHGEDGRHAVNCDAGEYDNKKDDAGKVRLRAGGVEEDRRCACVRGQVRLLAALATPRRTRCGQLHESQALMRRMGSALLVVRAWLRLGSLRVQRRSDASWGKTAYARQSCAACKFLARIA